ncbi:Deoxynucleoside kinase [Paragonimus heterotremus]|uniref:Deoxynucleoside kinase n=1 Tax=Paragonimus heterotremus TaxID=100268 RepID=A0A8J4SKA1_9TREM|nr:Deoxynucleoside kinase [Paragonimus heterotremus]
MGLPLQRFTVTVEGNIGCGKSTFLRYFEQLSTNAEVLQEPIYLWKDTRGHNLFELMYQDSTRWAVPFQAQVLVTLLDRQLKPQTAPVRLVERSVYSCRYCFVENMHKDGHISASDYDELDGIFKWAFKEKAGPINLIVRQSNEDGFA